MNGDSKQIFAAGSASEFVGRTIELERILGHAAGHSSSSGLALLATPSAGASELLRQVYDRLFAGQDATIPFYFEIRETDLTAQDAARRFLHEFLLQTVAFRLRAPGLIDSSPEVDEIVELAVPSDGHWIDRLADAYRDDTNEEDERAFVRNCLSAPLRAAAGDAPSFVMIDGLHVTSRLENGEMLFAEIEQIFSTNAPIRFVLAGQRRYLYSRTQLETMHLERFSFVDAGKFAEMLSARTGVPVNDQTRDLLAVQLDGNAGYMSYLFASAAAHGNELTSFDRVQEIYTDEMFGGRIGKSLDASLSSLVPDAEMQHAVLGLLCENMAEPDGKMPVAHWKKNLGVAASDVDAILEGLHCHEIASISSGRVVTDEGNVVVGDYIRSRQRLEILGEARALAVGETLTKNIKRAPRLMARFYRRRSAIGLRELMLAFDGRNISPALIDYARFENQFKGALDDKILKAAKEDNEKIVLPKIVYTAHTAAFYPQLNELCENERSAVALGFTDGTEADETVWIAAEIDSKLEADRELTEFWCDRLEMAAINSNFAQFRLWLVAPEGFAPGAIEVLRERNAYGSSRKQVDLMTRLLNAVILPADEEAPDEYEIIVPMGDETEMIAAHTIEEIARRHKFGAKSINQIKTALVEACINAAEHSLSPDQKIYQKFSVNDDKITITIANRGLRLADKKGSDRAPAGTDARRGWGLKLIKGLMDEVKFEQTDDGTQITMVKYLKAV